MSRTRPLISVVTVVWNNLPGLLHTVESLSRQTYPEIEHIVVDGDSNDGTKDWLKKYSPNYQMVSVSEEDEGLYDAMNKGVRMASGDLVVFLNSDDTFSSPSVLSTVASDWSSGDWQWGYGAIRNLDLNRDVRNGYVHAPFSLVKFKLGLRFVPHPATFMSRTLLLELGGFKAEYGSSADQELLMRAALKSKPRVWVEFFSDFVLGGMSTANSGASFFGRFRQIRRDNGIVLFDCSGIDLLFTIGQKVLYNLRLVVSRLVNR